MPELRESYSAWCGVRDHGAWFRSTLLVRRSTVGRLRVKPISGQPRVASWPGSSDQVPGQEGLQIVNATSTRRPRAGIHCDGREPLPRVQDRR